MTSTRRGFTAVEVIVAVAVLAIAVIPVFMSTTSSAKNVRLTEYHVIAQARAKRVLEAFSTYSLPELRAANSGGSLPAPFADDDLDGGGFDLPPEYRRKMENFTEEYSFEELGPDLGLIRVKVQWTVQQRQLDYELFQVVAAEEPSDVVRPPLGDGS